MMSAASMHCGVRARDKEVTVGPVGMAHADMAVGVGDPFRREDAVCYDDFLDDRVEPGHEFLPFARGDGRGAARGWQRALSALRRRAAFA